MMRQNRFHLALWIPFALLSGGCMTAVKVDLATFSRPERAPEMDRFAAFIGQWDWEATMINAEGADRSWKGTAEWKWGLDQRVLAGVMSARSDRVAFEAEGVWSWHPRKKKYVWWMFNNWGYPQEGRARYNADSGTWVMPYKSVGLDGTTSYGRYDIRMVDHNTLDFQLTEWADPMHLFKKMEMKGSYRRR